MMKGQIGGRIVLFDWLKYDFEATRELYADIQDLRGDWDKRANIVAKEKK